MLGPGAGRGAVAGRAPRPDRARASAAASSSTCCVEARDRGFAEVLALTRRSSFFDALGFEITRRERFIDKLMVDCGACPLNVCCDEIAMVRPPARAGEFTPLPSDPPPAHKEL